MFLATFPIFSIYQSKYFAKRVCLQTLLMKEKTTRKWGMDLVITTSVKNNERKKNERIFKKIII